MYMKLKNLLLSLLFLTGNLLITNVSGQTSKPPALDRGNKFNIEIDESFIRGSQDNSYPTNRNQSSRLSETRIDSAKKYTYTTVFDSVPAIKEMYSYVSNTITRIKYDYDEIQQQWNPTEKHLKNYNTAGKLTKYTTYSWENSSWEPDFKEEYDFNAVGETEQYSSFRWDDANDQWDEGFRVEHFYNSENLLDHKLYYSDSSGTSNFGLYYKLEFGYNDNDDLSLRIDYVYDENSSSFVESEKTEWSFNDYHNYLQIIEYYWLEGTQTWQWDNKKEYSYDNDQNVTKLEEFIWDFAAFDWVEDTKTEYDHNAANNKVLEIESIWDSNEQSYVASSKKEWDYEGDLKIERRTYTYDEIVSSFKITDKVEYTYTAEGMLSSEAYYSWNSDNDSWTKNLKNTYQYNQFGDRIMFSFYFPDATGESWEISTRWFYYFDVLGTGTEDNKLSENEKFSVYPNPATNAVNFSFKQAAADDVTLRVFNSAGKLVYTKEIADYNNERLHWNCSSMPHGTYFAVWQTASGNYTRKVVIQ